MAAEQVHLLLVEHAGIEHRAGEESPDHEMQPGPVGRKTRYGQPDKPGKPAVALRDSPHQFAEEVRGQRENDEKSELSSHPIPVEEEEREHAPNGDVIEAGVTQNALTDRLAQDVELFQEQDQDWKSGHGAGHADADDQLPRMPFRSHPPIAHEGHD